MAFQFQSPSEASAPSTAEATTTRYHELSVASLKDRLKTRGITSLSDRKDHLIAALVLNDRFQTTSYYPGSVFEVYHATSNKKLKELIHSRISGRGLPVVGELLKNLHDNTLKDQLITILVVLDRSVIGGWLFKCPLRNYEKPHLQSHEELAGMLLNISKCSQQHRDPARVDYTSLPTIPKSQTTFTLLNKLPAELRTYIWEAYIQISGRVVTFTAADKRRIGIRMFTPPPASMLVNKESRAVTLKNYNYEKIFVIGGPAYVNLFHTTLDTLMISDRTLLYTSITKASPQLAQHLQDIISSELLKGVKNLALTSAELLKFPFSLRSPDVFPNLEQFTLVLGPQHEKLIFEPHQNVLVNYSQSRSWWAHISDHAVQAHINAEIRRLAKEYGQGKLAIRVKESLVYKSEVWG